ncbi:MAG: phosphoenolpyruvate synthase [Ardenticatenaceae bacterium]|nr:phosphoenolpyruvate synthase [Ardenticatenaceae bacterium]
MSHSTPLVFPFTAISTADLPIVGGKGANLGEMTQAGFPIPPGFCITTAAFQQFIAAYPQAEAMYGELEKLGTDDVATVRRVGEKIRAALTAVPIPPHIAEAIRTAWEDAGPAHSYAVRSSATAEDLPDASFAGQQDTYLNVRGPEALLDSVRRCWVSLFTDRAILYRTQNQFPHREVFLSVVVQRMVLPQVSGILFTADPVSGHRHITSIDASYGLGEALVAGLVNPDLYKVDKRTNQLVDKQIGDKQMAIRPLADGGTIHETIASNARTTPVLTDAQAIQLSQIGHKIEQHYGRPQDIEWCLQDGQFTIVQSRPITTLYPLPQPAPDDGSFRFYFSFGHAQVMTDPISAMGVSIIRILFPFGKADRPLAENHYLATAGGRIYADLTPIMHARLPRRFLPIFLSVAEPLSAQIVGQLVQRPEFAARPPKVTGSSWDLIRWLAPIMKEGLLKLWWREPEGAVDRANQILHDSYTAMQAQLAAAAPGSARLRVAHQILGTMFTPMLREMAPFLMSGMLGQQLLLRLARREGLQREAEATMRGLSGNVTTEMDLAVGDLADAARQSPALVAHLQNGEMALALQTAVSDPHAQAFHHAWQQFLQTYGMRGPSEIDITRLRWRDEPASVLRMVAGSLGYAEPGAHRRHHQQMAVEGAAAGERLVTAVHHGPLGALKAKLVHRLVRVGRNLMPVREHPKFLMIQMFGLVRTAVLEAAHSLHQQNRLQAVTDVWHLSLPELIAVLDDPHDDPYPRITQRQAEMARFQKLTPPRIITSDGETPTANHKHTNLPVGALAGSAVSAGIVEGIARVVLDPTQETLKPGEILVAPFTDPGWTPLFINAAGLVMEVGGLMTHGSVVAREYGIPAVVAVPEATKRIKTGQCLRVHGDGGYVEILDS